MKVRQVTMQLLAFGFMLFAISLLGACQRSQEPQTAEQAQPVEQAPAAAAGSGQMGESGSTAEEMDSDGAVRVVARDFAFEAPDELPLGWTTFRFHNEGAQTHFLILYRLPEGKHLADVQKELAPAFDQVMEARQNGEVDQAGALKMLGEQAPAWLSQLVYSGGVGLTAPGHTAQATVNLQTPGVYIMECYVKAPNGMFHSSMGMQHELVVTDETGSGTEPDADVNMTLSNSSIATDGALTSGRHTIRVHYAENPVGGFFFDVNLARLTDDTDVDALKHWMNWLNVGGLRAPAPAEFLGGSENMPAGNTAYFTVNLTPGRYMWLSEVDAEGNMASEFTVE